MIIDRRIVSNNVLELTYHCYPEHLHSYLDWIGTLFESQSEIQPEESDILQRYNAEDLFLFWVNYI